MRKSTIYVLLDPREIQAKKRYRYVGKTVKKLSQRLRDHITDSTRKQGKKWQYNAHKDRWIRKLVREGVEPEILKIEVVNEDKDAEREMYWIAHLIDEGFNLTNCTDGGEGKKGYVPSEETKEKIRQSLLGSTASKETRAKMSKAKQGSKNSNYGNKHSQETRTKMSRDRRGKKCGSENSFYGKKHSEETRRKISEALRKYHAKSLDFQSKGGML